MSSTVTKTQPASLTERLDSMYEFDKEPVTEDKLSGWKNFIGMFAGEHVAGTEFVIGPLFVAHGVTASDLFIGLLFGNLLAMLSWAFICAPIAVKTRLTLYWHLRKITGPYLLVIYNLINALMFCFLAGSMIAVSATAVGIPFGIPMPELADWLPTSVGWVVTVLGVGAVVTVLAILGFESLARFASVCAPWMTLIFIAAALASLPKLGVNSIDEFWPVAQERIWNGVPLPGQSKFTFWHVMFFAWFANMAMHIGMSDMSIFRYARKWYHGFASFAGVFVGHYVAWIAAGILFAAADTTSVAPGPIAYTAVGIAGAVCVVIAGWTTANPTIYRAGLALQVVSPGWKRWKVTLVAGVITSLAAMFPALVMQLLDFVALYGLILMPMGAVIFADFYLIPKIGLRREYAEWSKTMFSMPAALTWALTLGCCFLMKYYLGLDLFFLALPGWFIACGLYLLLSLMTQKKDTARA